MAPKTAKAGPADAKATASPSGSTGSKTVSSTARSASPYKLPAAARTGAAAKPKAAAAPAAAKAAPKGSGKTAAVAKAAGTGKATPATAAAAQPPSRAQPEPEMSEEQLRQKMQAALDKAMADTQEERQKAWMAQMEADRRAEAKRRQKAEEEARRKKQEAATKKALLEAAYDGEDEELTRLLATAATLGMKDPVDTADSHGNSLLSEAAAGGAVTTVKLLAQRGADPNARGEFGRTPLWRAAFLGKAEVVQPLLDAGADPRLGNEGGETPGHVAATPAIKEQLAAWDTAATDRLVASWEAQRAAQQAQVRDAARAAVQSAEGAVESARQEQERCQQALRHARTELEKRIFEHDVCVGEHKPEDLLKVTLEQIKMAEVVVAEAQARAAAAADALSSARLALREQQAAEQVAQGREAGPEDVAEPLPGLCVDIKDLDEVVIRDVGGKLAGSGKWPLVIDTSGQASVFLRYLDCNYVNALSSHATDPNRLRRSILGGIRYGKPVVLDLMDVALWPEMKVVFDRVQPNLLAALLNKSLLQAESYRSLIRKDDGEEYEPNKFQDARIARFQFIVHTALLRPDPDLLAATYPLRVLVHG